MSKELHNDTEHPSFSKGNLPSELTVVQFAGAATLTDMYGEKTRKCINISINDGENVLNSKHFRLTETQAKELCRKIANAYLPFHKQIPEETA